MGNSDAEIIALDYLIYLNIVYITWGIKYIEKINLPSNSLYLNLINEMPAA